MYSVEQIMKNLDWRDAFGVKKGEDGLEGSLCRYGTVLLFIFSFGGGWEHLSVSTQKRCPTWEEMCYFKDIFWAENECCVQYHPAKEQYVDCHKYCLHIWRPLETELPIPPSVFVGPK